MNKLKKITTDFIVTLDHDGLSIRNKRLTFPLTVAGPYAVHAFAPMVATSRFDNDTATKLFLEVWALKAKGLPAHQPHNVTA